MYNSNYFNRNLIESMKNTLLKMVNEQEGGNLSMGRLTDAERAAGNARVAAAPAAAPKPIKYTSFGSGNYGIMASPGDFSKLGDNQLENRMRQIKKGGGLFQSKVPLEKQSDEYKAYAAELARRKAPKQEAPKQEAPAVTSDPAPQMVAAANYELTPEMKDDMRRNEKQTGIRQAGLGSVTPAPGVGRPDMPFDAAFNPMGHSVKGRGLSTSDRAAAERAAAEFGSTGRTSPSTVGNSRTHSVTPGSAGRPDMPFHAQHNPQGYQPKGRGLNADEQEQARVAGQEFRNTGSVTPGRKATGSSPRGFVPTNPFM